MLVFRVLQPVTNDSCNKQNQLIIHEIFQSQNMPVVSISLVDKLIFYSFDKTILANKKQRTFLNVKKNISPCPVL